MGAEALFVAVAFLFVVLSGAGKAPLWPAVLCLTVIELLRQGW